MYKHLGKRLLDLILSSFALFILLPVVALIIFSYWILEKNMDILFVQIRPGKNGKLFKLYKFKTMRTAFNSKGELLSDKERITFLGSILRKTSLDEIPQLVNVLKGDMSVVGPRPLLPEYLDKYTPTEARRHEVLPGITGWAQVNGRNTVSFKRRFEYDVFYVDHCSILFDLKIMFLTIQKIFTASDILEQDPNKISDGNGE